MKDKNILICVGIIIYIAMSGIDRFVYHIPNITFNEISRINEKIQIDKIMITVSTFPSDIKH